MADAVWRYIVRPIAVGGMLVGAAYTLYKMRASLTAGIGKAFADLRQTADQQAKLARTERYMSSKIVFGLIARHVHADVPALHSTSQAWFGRQSWRRSSCCWWDFSSPRSRATWWESSAHPTIRSPA